MKHFVNSVNRLQQRSNETGSSLISYVIAVAILVTGAIIYIQSLEDAIEEQYNERVSEHDFTGKQPLITPTP
jgi:hypothetical protein